MLVLNESNVRSILGKISENTPIGVITVAGDFRTGKSTLLNLIIHILIYYERYGTLDGFNENELKFNLGYSNGTNRSVNGFEWKSGHISCTKGINMCSRPFFIPNPQKSWEKMAVLLVDCEGLQASESIRGADEKLFVTSNLISSMLIMNTKSQIRTGDLMTLGSLAEKCTLIRERINGKKCSLEYLMRDFKFESEEYYEQINQMKDFCKNLLNSSYYRVMVFNIIFRLVIKSIEIIII